MTDSTQDTGHESLFNRASDDRYRALWTEQISQPKREHNRDGELVLIFRIGEDLLALPTAHLQTVRPPVAIHRIPHRPRPICGLANVDGMLAICVCLGTLIQRPPADPDSPTAKLIMLGESEQTHWAFIADEVLIMHRLDSETIQTLPVTVSQSPTQRTRMLFEYDNQHVALLDAERIQQAIERSLA